MAKTNRTHNLNNNNNRMNWPLYNLLSVVAVGLMIIIGMATNTISTSMLLEIGKEFGLPGIILMLWYATNRSNQRNISQYHNDVLEMREMYQNNVKLVERYAELSGDLKDVLIMNTQIMTTMCKDIECVLEERKRGPS